MTETSSDAFLSGQGIPVDPHDIETELTRLWGPAAERVGGPSPESPNVTRIVLANLVVASRLADAPRLDGVLDTLTTRYPCRAIVALRTDEPDRRVSAEVSALCHLPAPGLPQVCSERIVLRAGPGPSTCCRVRSARCSRPTSPSCSGGPTTPGSTRRSSATWPANARG